MKVTKLYMILCEFWLLLYLLCSVKKVWLTCWSTGYTWIKSPLFSIKEHHLASYSFPLLCWSTLSQLSGFACVKDFQKNHRIRICVLISLRRNMSGNSPYIKLKLCGGEAQRSIRTANKLLPNYIQGEGLDSCL